MEMAAQGQSFFAASGDTDSRLVNDTVSWPSAAPNLTFVGGTELIMNGSGASYASETVWNQGGGEGSSGGVNANYAFPYWQQGVSMTANGGSANYRNFPDVAMLAYDVDIRYGGGSENTIGGTSAAAPLWAGFMALVNQQAASLGKPSAGFINPAIYAIGKGTNYTPYASAFHDITTGSNGLFSAVAGYDLCTGWGTPTVHLINALADNSPVVWNTNDSGPGSLRQAIANAFPGAYINFATNLAGATILLTSGQLMISSNLTIDASALAGGLAINGNHANPIFYIVGSPTPTIKLAALILTNGYSSSRAGGAIVNGAVLSLNNCTLAGNSTGSGAAGGAIYNSGLLTLTGCTFSGNVAGSAGAILNQSSVCTVQNCTFAGNTASAGIGGAILSDYGATLNLLHCTFTGNSSTGLGGDVFNVLSLVNTTNTIMAGSTPDDIYNVSNSVVGSTNTFGGSNIVQVIDNAGTLIGTSTILAVNPNLAPLGNYGGPTPTMPPLPGSPAIDAAPFTTLLTDQRGYPRMFGRAPDIGAVEGVHNPAGPGKLKNVTRLGNGSVSFTLTNYSDMSFTVLASTNLALPFRQWSNLGTAVESPLGSGQYPFTDMQGTNYSRRFYTVTSP